jgi:hypothetical protein
MMALICLKSALTAVAGRTAALSLLLADFVAEVAD